MNLPTEILITIISSIDDIKTILKMRKVCRKTENIVSNVSAAKIAKTLYNRFREKYRLIIELEVNGFTDADNMFTPCANCEKYNYKDAKNENDKKMVIDKLLNELEEKVKQDIKDKIIVSMATNIHSCDFRSKGLKEPNNFSVENHEFIGSIIDDLIEI